MHRHQVNHLQRNLNRFQNRSVGTKCPQCSPDPHRGLRSKSTVNSHLTTEKTSIKSVYSAVYIATHRVPEETASSLSGETNAICRPRSEERQPESPRALEAVEQPVEIEEASKRDQQPPATKEAVAGARETNWWPRNWMKGHRTRKSSEKQIVVAQNKSPTKKLQAPRQATNPDISPEIARTIEHQPSRWRNQFERR